MALKQSNIDLQKNNKKKQNKTKNNSEKEKPSWK